MMFVLSKLKALSFLIVAYRRPDENPDRDLYRAFAERFAAR